MELLQPPLVFRCQRDRWWSLALALDLQIPPRFDRETHDAEVKPLPLAGGGIVDRENVEVTGLDVVLDLACRDLQCQRNLRHGHAWLCVSKKETDFQLLRWRFGRHGYWRSGSVWIAVSSRMESRLPVRTRHKC